MNYLSQIGSVQLIKQLNYAMVFKLISQQSPISRIKLAELSTLAPASITKITREFLKYKLIKEVEVQASTGGRPAVSLQSRFDYYHAVAINLSRDEIIIELYQLGGKRLICEKHAFTNQHQSQAETHLTELIQTFTLKHSKKIKKLIAIAVIMPGVIDSDLGIVRYTPHIQVNDWHLAKALKSAFNVMIFLGNDVQSIALAESYFGTEPDNHDLILIRVHHGIGAGVILEQQMFINKQHACEIGHIQVNSLGEKCHCGNFGCLESEVSNINIEQKAKTLLAQGFNSKLDIHHCDIKSICDFANKGDVLAVKLIENASENIGKAAAIMVNIFNPKTIILAGEITASSDILTLKIKEALKNQSVKSLQESVNIRCSQLDNGSAIGAYALVTQSLMSGELLSYIIK